MIEGRLKNIDNIKIREEKISTKLNMSPKRTNIPFNNNNPAQKRRYGIITLIPKINIRKAIAAAISIPPRIFTKSI